MKATSRDLDELLTVMAFCMVDWLKELSPMRLLKTYVTICYKTIFRSMGLEHRADIEGQVVLFQSMFRTDYDELVGNVLNGMGNDAVFVGVRRFDYRRGSFGQNRRVPVHLMISRIGLACFEAISFRNLLIDSSRRRGFAVSTFLYLSFIKLRLDLRELVKQGPKSVVVFAEMQPMDRIITMLCHEMKIPCATMQHGLYSEYLKTDTVNRYNYQPVFVDLFLAWGSHTRELVRKYAPSVSVKVCGRPTLQPTNIKVLKKVFDVVVIFDQELFTKENREMLNIIKSEHLPANHRIGVRLHPRNDPSDYDLDEIEVLEGEDWLATDCFVGHSTSFLVDILETGLRLLRYDSGAESVIKEPAIEFQNKQDYSRLLRSPATPSQNLHHGFISCRGEASIQAHSEAIREMN